MGRIAVQFACWLLKLPLSLRNRTKLTGAILDSLNAVPLHTVIQEHNGFIFVNGKQLDYEQSRRIVEAARAMQNNAARTLVREQIAVIAGTRGVVQGDTPEKLYFYRAALWNMQSEDELYTSLASLSTEEN